jgi:hypothetical protein
MTTSKSIAGLIGPALVAIAGANLLNLGSLPALMEQASRDLPLIYMSGILMFVAGLAIVRVHNRWAMGWELVVTILGWLVLAGGIARMGFTTQLGHIAAAMGSRTDVMIAILAVLFAIGAFLSLKAYGRE